MRVYTNIKVLKQVKRVLAELDLSGLVDNNAVQNIDLSEILDKLLDQGKLVEFLQIVTKDTQTDFFGLTLTLAIMPIVKGYIMIQLMLTGIKIQSIGDRLFVALKTHRK